MEKRKWLGWVSRLGWVREWEMDKRKWLGWVSGLGWVRE